MKILRITLMLLFGTFLFVQPVGAIISSAHASTTTVEQQTSSLKKEFKSEKKLSKFQKYFQKGSVDLNDPVKKWLWYGLGLAIIAVVLNITISGALASIAWAAAGICIIIWLLKFADVI